MASSKPAWPGAPSSTRRIATVTICAPLAAIASRITEKSLYFPVPTSSRESKARPPMMRWSSRSYGVTVLPSLPHGDDLDDVFRVERRVRDPARVVDVVAPHDGDDAAVDLELIEQLVQREPGA